MIRWLKYHSLQMRRLHPPSGKTLLARFLHSELVQWNRSTATRGTAIGMFLAFVPMPFQMLPAFLFCWLLRGNLAIAIFLVWVSNPITLPPIIYLEYRIGEFFYANFVSVEQAVATGSIWMNIAGGLKYVLIGSLFLSSFMMIVGYVAMQLAFSLSDQRRRRRTPSARQPEDA